MNRRGFLGLSLAAAGMVFAPKFGRWHRQGSGLLVPRPGNSWYVALYTSDGKYHRIPAVVTETTLLGDGTAVVNLADCTWRPPLAVTVTRYAVGGDLSGLPVQTGPTHIERGGIALDLGSTLTFQWPDYGLRLIP